eukprot:scaffold50775_cov33-Phaeocystis_antarctica.AAC.2
MGALALPAMRRLARRRGGSRGRGRPRHGASRRTRRRRRRLLVARLRVAGGRVARLRGRAGRPARRRSRRGGRRAVGRVAGRGRAARRGQHGRWRRRADSVESRRHRAAEDAREQGRDGVADLDERARPRPVKLPRRWESLQRGRLAHRVVAHLARVEPQGARTTAQTLAASDDGLRRRVEAGGAVALVLARVAVQAVGRAQRAQRGAHRLLRRSRAGCRPSPP